MDREFNQWLLKYLLGTYGNREEFNNLWEKIDSDEVREAISVIYDSMPYFSSDQLPIIITYFSKLSSIETLKEVFEKPIWNYSSLLEIKGIFAKFRSLIEELVARLCEKAKIETLTYNKEIRRKKPDTFYQKLEKLLSDGKIDEPLKCDLINLYKSQSAIIHDPAKRNDNIKRLRQAMIILEENVLPKFKEIFELS